MLIAICSLVVGVLLFLCMLLGFVMGIRLSIQIQQGNMPEIKSPAEIVQNTVQTVQEIKDNMEHRKEEKAVKSDIEKIFGYTGDIPPDEKR